MSSNPVHAVPSGSPAREPAGRRPAAKGWRARHPWLAWMVGTAAVVLIGITVMLYVTARRFEPYLRARIVEGLQERFHTRVELAYFHVAVHHGQEATWGLWAKGRGLRIWPPHREGGDHPLETAVESKPLIDVAEFSFHVPLRFESNKPIRVPQVRIKGLRIEVPPRSERDKQTGLEAALHPPAEQRPANDAGTVANVIVEKVTCDEAELTLETDKPDKLPMSFDIRRLTLNHLKAGEPMRFEAEVLNPQPKGVVHTSGSFGPWLAQDPGDSALNGSYSMANADLSTFHGIAGTIQSEGSFEGTLRGLVVKGHADVGDFRLTHFGNSLPLHTRFTARVDGTNGDTRLDAVDATLGDSHFSTRGEIVRVVAREQERLDGGGKPSAGKRAVSSETPGLQPRGHRIELKVNIDRGKMSDLMRLVSKSAQPLLVGDVVAQANLLIPPGSAPVHLRMKLDGHFALDDARFTSEKIQNKVEDLSLRGQDRPDSLKTTDAKSIRSSMEGEFRMADGVITLPDLHYSVPGAQIQLAGTYALDGPLHLDGTARMNATVSQMVGGWKGVLLKPFDRVFRKDGAGALVPIQVRGTREEPQFGVDLGRIGHTAPQRPGRQ